MTTPTPPPPTEPLDSDERELARILQALPAGEPSPALDQAVLRRAADAAGGGRARPVARWLAFGGAGWGIGGAAAAVLALGVGLQLFDPARPIEDRSAPVPVSADASESISVEIGAPATPPVANLAPGKVEPAEAVALPPSEPQLRRRAPRSAASSTRSEPRPLPDSAFVAPPAPPPAPPVAPQLPGMEAELQRQAARGRDATASRAAAAAAAAAEDRIADDSRARQAAPVVFPADAVLSAKASVAPAPATAGSASERDASAGAEASPARMAPGRWLAHIRKLRDEGRLDAARASLREFQRRHPRYALPADLQALARE